MWQVLLGIYTIVILLSTVLLWSSLVVAKRSDWNTTGRLHPMIGLTANGEANTVGMHDPISSY